MIIYDGIKVVRKVHFLSFTNEKKESILIPMQEQEARRISLYIDRLSTVNRKPVERQNDDEVD